MQDVEIVIAASKVQPVLSIAGEGWLRGGDRP
jgi:hypothetical protein